MKGKNIPLSTTEKEILELVFMHDGEIPLIELQKLLSEQYNYFSIRNMINDLVKRGHLTKVAEFPHNVMIAATRKETRILPQSAAEDGDVGRQTTLDGYGSRGELRINRLFPNQFTLCQLQMDVMDAISSSRMEEGSRGRRGWGALRRLKAEITVCDEKVLEFVADYLEAAGFVKRFGNMVRTTDKTPKFLLSDPVDVLKSVFEREFIAPHTGMGEDTTLEDNTDDLLAALGGCPEGDWVEFGAFISRIRETLFSIKAPKDWLWFRRERLWGFFKDILELLGMVELGDSGEKSQQKRFFRITPLGRYVLGGHDKQPFEAEEPERHGKFIVIPNFEIIAVLDSLGVCERLHLEKLTHLKKRDYASIYNITRESIKRAIRYGLSGSDIMEFLKAGCQGELPQNVEYSIREWGRE